MQKKKYFSVMAILILSTLVIGLNYGVTGTLNELVPVIPQKSLTSTPDLIQKSSDVTTVEAASKKYVASYKSKPKVYHKLKCHYVKRIKKSNKVYFSTKTSAKRSGYRPCKICRG